MCGNVCGSVDRKMMLIEAFAAEKFGKNKHTCHDFCHVKRVLSMAVSIGKKEGADLGVLRAAALLHDIARAEETQGGLCHAKESAKIARIFLKNAGFESEFIERAASCIEKHRYRANENGDSLEEKIIQDADRLDAIGAVGIARAFMFGGEHSRPMYIESIPPEKDTSVSGENTFNHFYKKLLKLKDTMHTQTAKNMAEKRHKFMEKYLAQFRKEANLRSSINFQI